VLTNRPDHVILDINMPILDGFGAAIQIHEHAADIPILFFTMHYGDSFLSQARRIGVQGYVSKDRAGEMLVEAVNALLQNKTYFPNTQTSLGVETNPQQPR
jgi:DNA-binding NarL/FixJ family response regulator